MACTKGNASGHFSVFNPFEDRKSRGLLGTYKEEMTGSWLLKEHAVFS